MKTRFAFGKHGIDVTVPGAYDCQIVHSRTANALPDAPAALEAALDSPIGSPALAALAAGKRTAAIAVCDITRPAPNRITLPPLLKRMHQAGIPKDGITILIATGLHRGATKEELDIIVGPEIAAAYRVANHDARDFAAHRSLGSTRRGTPVYIDERFMAADLHISLGFVEPHLMLGFSGGRKLVVPGVAAQETIKVIHSPRFVREPLATEGSIEGNPLHAEFLEIAAMVRHDFILDVTLNRERHISGVFAGNPVKAHAAAVAFFESTSLASLDGLFDAAITSAAGFPLDLTFYQCLKGLTATKHIVKPGGPMLLLSECTEGIGSPEYARELKEYEGHAEFLEKIRERKELGSLRANAFATVDEAIAAFLSRLPQDARIGLVPEGPYTYARAVPAYV
jgi:nickel-dependent lactate racemase